jgi:hypothetical protein
MLLANKKIDIDDCKEIYIFLPSNFCFCINPNSTNRSLKGTTKSSYHIREIRSRESGGMAFS